MEIESDEDMPLASVAKRKVSLDGFTENDPEEIDKDRTGDKHADVKDKEIHEVDILFEYKWPDQNNGVFYHIEEQLLEFLGIESSDLRLKGLEGRAVSNEEMMYLKGKSIHGSLTNKKDVNAVKTEDAFMFLAEYFPEKFKIYIKLVHKKEMRKLVRKQEAQRVDVIKGKIPNIMKRSLKETVRYNSRLNSERMEERQAYFDLQTQIIHLPQKKRKYNPDFKPMRSRYPVSLMPGQYQDYFRRFTHEELKALPLNTILINTKAPSHKNKDNENVVQSQVVETDDAEEASVDDNNENDVAESSPAEQGNQDKDPFCGICMKGPEMNKRGLPEKLIHCSQCENSGHPSCLDMNRHIVQVIQTYPWQCMECKICTECLAPHDEESMMFCDNCDRGYHGYCVGLKEIPRGRWVCGRCGKCSSCLGTDPVPDGGTGRWKNEVWKPLDGGESEFLQIHCHPCSKLFRKGSFCPVCIKVYRDSEDHINPMVCCDTCDRWIHTDCDGIDEHRYMELSKDRKSSYTCILCRGEKEERMDSFHRKHR